MSDYTIRPARYAKGKMAVSCPSTTGFKTRAAYLAVRLSGGNYTGRENAYIMSQAAAERFERLYALGWDGNLFGDELIAPDGTRFGKLLPTAKQENAFPKKDARPEPDF